MLKQWCHVTHAYQREFVLLYSCIYIICICVFTVPGSLEKSVLNCKNKRCTAASAATVQQPQVVQLPERAACPEVLFPLARSVVFLERLEIEWNKMKKKTKETNNRKTLKM